MPTATVIGSTGLVGSNILSQLLASETWSALTTISRRAPNVPEPAPVKLTQVLEADIEAWPSKLATPPSDTLFSALGTTRAAAGGIANQWKIDHDANVALAKKAKEQGVKTFVFISSAGTDSFMSKFAPYSKMKNGVENAIKEAEFENAIILKPGLIMGEREVGRAGEGVAQAVVRGLGGISEGLKNSFGQEGSVIARAAVKAAEMAAEGKAPSKYWVIGQGDIVKMGKPEKPST